MVSKRIPVGHLYLFIFFCYRYRISSETTWQILMKLACCVRLKAKLCKGERGGSVVECRTPEREVRGSRPTAAVLCPWARHFTSRKYWLITQEAMAPSRHDWKFVDWDVKPQHNQPTKLCKYRKKSGTSTNLAVWFQARTLWNFPLTGLLSHLLHDHWSDLF